MKKYTILVAVNIVVFFILQSCKKETLQKVDKFENLSNLSDAAEKRIAFSGLTSVEKADFWKYTIKNNMTGLTPSQRKLVGDIYSQLSPAVYEKGTNDHITFTTLIVPAWLKKAEAIFSKDKISELFYFLEGEKVVDVTANAYTLDQLPIYDESAPNCMCNIGSTYSCRKREISVGTTGAQMKTVFGSCTYSSSSYICDRDDYGCGFAGLWSCNGNSCIF